MWILLLTAVEAWQARLEKATSGILLLKADAIERDVHTAANQALSLCLLSLLGGMCRMILLCCGSGECCRQQVL